MTTNCYDSMVPFKVLYFQWMTRWSQHTIFLITCIEIFKTLNLYIERFLAQESLGPNAKWVWITKEKCLKCFETASVNNSIEEHLWKITATFFLLLCCAVSLTPQRTLKSYSAVSWNFCSFFLFPCMLFFPNILI